MAMYLQGKYVPVNPKKYKGDVNKIVFRSSLELVAFKFCDMNPAIIFWENEETVIPYISPVDGRAHRYFMDLKVWTRRQDSDELQITLIEIKPKDQIKEPRKTKTMKESTFNNSMRTWLVNQAKWTATKEHCAKVGWKFIIWTEEHLVPGEDPEVKKQFALRSKKKREVEIEDRRRAQRINALKEQMKKETSNKQTTNPEDDGLLLP
ncbi:head completion protein [Salmonella phage S115]|uniref:Head completion nuclease n=4 Tax=Kuttervirus TaxID=2169536 RepID=A0A2Z5HM69_9CAUD|nr:head completion protein [Salmonella phage S118]YP_009883158.1 head completion protein [Salmonella phage SS9]YP_009887475.1 head completion protein [Salmonella phage rabagast]AXC40383.1 head completion protein [Salmonella phage S115]QEI23981.1 head completion protein [Salmonella phage SS3]AXC40950.1 head completion protein [Salmonella phage S118]QEI24234.1 head completion protein [Salmonella phage SS9]QIQ61816.1 head completion protein [Salmonella phage rabagast]